MAAIGCEVSLHDSRRNVAAYRKGALNRSPYAGFNFASGKSSVSQLHLQEPPAAKETPLPSLLMIWTAIPEAGV